MLVLSRSEGEGIVVPDLDLAVRILRVAGGRVRVGVEAPEHIRVLRSELVERAEEEVHEQPTASARHALRNRLNRANLGLAIAEKHLERGHVAKAEKALQDAVAGLVLESQESPHEVTPAPRAEWSVLLVEDNRIESSLLAEVLRLSGIDVRVAGNGAEAIVEMNRRRPDIVLLDMHMPVCDGPTTIRKIRGDRRFDNIAVYAVTGTTMNEMELTQGEMGIRRWFQKPVQSGALVQAIRDECSNSQLSC